MSNRCRNALGRWGITGAYLLAAYVVVAVSMLIFLRTQVGTLDFIGAGWIIVLALLPALPWLLPRLGGFLKTISPYVQSFSLGAVKLEFRDVRSDAIAIPTTNGILASVPNDLAALSSGTTISLIASSLHDLRREGGSPVGIIDLRDGLKWRLPNLYFLARLLEIELVVSQLVFTEEHGGTDGYPVGSCSPDELRRRIEQKVPTYTSATSTLRLPARLNLANPNQAQEVGTAFQEFQIALGLNSGRNDDPIHGFVTSARIAELAGPLSNITVEALGETLNEQSVREILRTPYQFVPATMSGRLTGLIDRDAVALAVARAIIAGG